MTIIKDPREADEGYQEFLTQWREDLRKYWAEQDVVEALEYLQANLPQDYWRAYVYQEARWQHISLVVAVKMFSLLKKFAPSRSPREQSLLFLAVRDEYWRRGLAQRPFAPFNVSNK